MNQDVPYLTEGFQCEECPAFPHGEVHIPGCAGAKLRLGARVVFVEPFECFPHFIVPTGARGTVTILADGDIAVAVEMDDPLPGCEAWDNEVHFYSFEMGETREGEPFNGCDLFGEHCILVGYDPGRPEMARARAIARNVP